MTFTRKKAKPENRAQREPTNQITWDGEAMEEVGSFTYMRSIIDKRGSDAYLKA